MASKKETAAEKKARQQRAAQRRASAQSMRERTQRTGTKAKVQQGTKPGTPVAKQRVSGAKLGSTVSKTRVTRTKADTVGGNKPNGRQPRALTNGGKPVMRQLRAKAIQAQRQAQDKTTVASRNQRVTPTNAAGQRIKDMARQQRVIGDSGQVRAAQQRGAQLKAEAQARRNARAVSKHMEGILKAAKLARDVVGTVKTLGRGGVIAAGIQAYNSGDGTLDAARKRGDLNKRRTPTTQESQMYAAQEAKARAANAKRRASASSKSAASFDDAFRAARKAGVKSFTWNGKKYTTDVK